MQDSRTPRLVEHFWVPIFGASCSNKLFVGTARPSHTKPGFRGHLGQFFLGKTAKNKVHLIFFSPAPGNLLNQVFRDWPRSGGFWKQLSTAKHSVQHAIHPSYVHVSLPPYSPDNTLMDGILRADSYGIALFNTGAAWDRVPARPLQRHGMKAIVQTILRSNLGFGPFGAFLTAVRGQRVRKTCQESLR